MKINKSKVSVFKRILLMALICSNLPVHSVVAREALEASRVHYSMDMVQTSSITKKDDYPPSTSIKIIALNKVGEIIRLENVGDTPINLSGCTIISTRGSQQFTFPSYMIKPGEVISIGKGQNAIVDFYWFKGNGIWNNLKSDPAKLMNDKDQVIDIYKD